jgi:S1-C subfamily serine protease
VRGVAILLLLFGCERAQDSKPTPEPPPVIPEPPAVKQGFIGIKYVNNGGDGVRVESLIPNMPAERAGILPDDIIVTFDREPVRGVEFSDQVLAAKPGHIANVVVRREGQLVTILLPIAKWPDKDTIP